MEANAFDDNELHVETATIMFADVVESVRLVGNDEERNVRRIVALLKRCCEEVRLHDGTVLEVRGDGLLVRFSDARVACVCAQRFHEFASEASSSSQADDALFLRIGINLDALLTDGNQVFGSAVNRAARIAGLAQPGSTRLSDRAREQVVEGVDGWFEDQGLSYVKHESAPVRTYSVWSLDRTSPCKLPLTLFEDLRPRLAVLPSTRMSSDQRTQRIRDAFCDCVTALLSRSLAFRVVSRVSASLLADRNDSIGLARSRLGCDYVVVSTLGCEGAAAQVAVELIHTTSGTLAWEGRFSASPDALIDPQGDILAQIASTVTKVLANRHLSRLEFERLPNIESQGLMVAGVNLLHRQEREDFNRSRQIFEHLAERHPRNPLPYTWLAAWRVFNVTQGWFTDFATESSVAASYADRAIDLHSEAPLAHSVRGLVATNLEREFDRAESHFRSALAVDDCDAMAWLHRGVSKAFVGDGENAVNYTVEARGLSPLDPWSYYFDSLGASAAFAAGRYELAVSLGLSSLRANSLHVSTLRVLAMSYAEIGDASNASTYLARVLHAEPTLTVAKYLSRSPSAGRPMALMCAEALRKAGLRER